MAVVDENFAIDLTDKCATEEQWFSVVQFWMPTLLDNPPLLMECIVRRAQWRIDNTSAACTHVVADEARDIMQKLGLKFQVKAGFQ